MPIRERRRLKDDEDSNCYVDKKLNTIYVSGEITSKIASNFRRHLRAMEKVNKHIVLELNSPGGDIQAGLMIIDTIKLCKRKVVVRVTGEAMSMACVILACGDIREALPNSSIMAHQGTYWVKERFHDLDNEIEEVKRLEKLCLKLMDEHTNKESGYWEKVCGTKNLYITADMALREGLIDRICTKG